MRVNPNRARVAPAGYVHPFDDDGAIELRLIYGAINNGTGGVSCAVILLYSPLPVDSQAVTFLGGVRRCRPSENELLFSIANALIENLSAEARATLPRPPDAATICSCSLSTGPPILLLATTLSTSYRYD